jgi:hypothetical protein
MTEECSKCHHHPRSVSRTGREHSWCKRCLARDRRQRYALDPAYGKALAYKSRRRQVDILRGRVDALKRSPCADCKRKFHPVVMDFDHLDPSKKSEDVARMVGRAASWKAVVSEIAKCDLVCSNCHRIRTWIKGRSKKGTRYRIVPAQTPTMLWVVLGPAPRRGGKNALSRCRCACGSIHEVRNDLLKAQLSLSCGCVPRRKYVLEVRDAA